MFSFFFLFVLAENSIPFLATILPFPLIIIIASLSVCILDLSVTAADKDKGNHSCTKSNTRGKSNETTQTDETNQTNDESYVQEEERKTMPILTVLQAVICVFFLLYECNFDFIIH